MASTHHSHRDGLSPTDAGWRDAYLDLSRIEAGGAQFDGNPVSNDGVILATLAGDPGADGGGRLLADPYMNQAAELDNAKQNR